MCLLVAFNEYEVLNDVRWGVGYKMLEDRNGPLNWNFMQFKLDSVNLAKGCSIKTRWVEIENGCADSSMLYGSKYNNIGARAYQSGFHIFLNKNDCYKYYSRGEESSAFITRVLYNEITCIGVNGSNYYDKIEGGAEGLCVVANQLWIKTQDWNNRIPLQPERHNLKEPAKVV